MSPLSPHTADSIAGYTLIERIGAGGYGEVWKAEAPGGLSKAVKLVYGYLDDQRAACERKALARIKEARHPFLLSLERIEIVDGQLVVVTELADKSLKDRFDECRNEGLAGIPRDELLVYMGDAADALDYMRVCHGLQHLDVKPENLLITSGRVKVADFGLVKSLQDDERSLLAGLTPQYAPPELFDGSPSTASDQYSLAIVYQEMLTGIPPFPGRTAAQLASQHLHSQPRLTGLAPHDRSALTRALAKGPAQRFACCRDLVDALRGAEAPALNATPADASHNDPAQTGSSDTNSLADKDTSTPRTPQAPSSAAQSAVGSRTLVIDQDAPALSDSGSMPAAMPLELPPATDPVRLPPIGVSTAQWTPMPCLVLGIGGTSADVLRGLRKRILRDEESFRQENLEFLLLDTDATAIDSACDDRCDDSLEFRETLHIPLRSSADYRDQSTDHLQWLSRRWLYNIPRSLRTEGRRPLGRLAFVDHRSQVRKRIAEALAATADKIRLGETEDAAGREGKRLRVVLVSSISGGSGSGIVPDIGYLVRQAMEEMGLPSQEICAVLTHGTSSNPDQQDLAIANTYACLSELNHYAERGYPGDPSCGLASSTQPAFDHTYLVHLGDELATQAYSVAVTQVAEYLYLNFASPAGTFFDTLRTDQSQDGNPPDHGTLRTFGLIQFDPHHNDVTSLATEELGRCVVARWLGGEKFFDERSVEAYLEDEFPELKEAKDSKKRRRRKKSAGTTDHKTGLQYLLEPDALHGVLNLAVEQQLGGSGARVFQDWICQGLKRGLGEKRAFLKDLARSLAPRRNVGEATDEPLTELEQSLADASAKLAVMAVESIREVLVRLVANPDARIVGAQKAAQWLCDRLRQFERTTTTEWTRISDRLTALEKLLPDRVSAGGGFWGRKRKRGETWTDYCQLRSHIVVIESIARFVRRVNTHLSDYREQLKNAQFSLSRVASQFGSQQDWLDAIEMSQSEETETRVLSQTIGKLIQSRMAELVDQLDRALGGELIRLESTTTKDREPPNVQRMARTVRVKSWAFLTRTLHELDLPSRMFTGEGESVRQIRDFLPNALPRLPRSGGGERLLAVFPKSTDEGTVRSGLNQCEEGQFSLAQAGESELALCYEVQGLNLPIVAARLAEHRENCILAAGRLHTRIDVLWPDRMTWE